MQLIEYIAKHCSGSQAAFAIAQGVKPPQITQWINKGFIVVGGTLYSPRRELNTVLNGAKANINKDGEE